MLLNIVIILVIGVQFAKTDHVDFSDCGLYRLNTVDIEGCTNIPCTFRRGGEYKISMNFQSPFESDSLFQKVHVTLYNVHLEVDVFPNNPCAGITCPVGVTSATNFTAILNIPRNMIPARGELWWKMMNEKGVTTVCMRTPVIICK